MASWLAVTRIRGPRECSEHALAMRRQEHRAYRDSLSHPQYEDDYVRLLARTIRTFMRLRELTAYVRSRVGADWLLLAVLEERLIAVLLEPVRQRFLLRRHITPSVPGAGPALAMN